MHASFTSFEGLMSTFPSLEEHYRPTAALAFVFRYIGSCFKIYGH